MLASSSSSTSEMADMSALLSEYASLGGEYASSTSRKFFVNALGAGKLKLNVKAGANSGDSVLMMEGASHSRFVDAVDSLAKDMVELQEAEEQLASLKRRLAREEEGGGGDTGMREEDVENSRPATNAPSSSSVAAAGAAAKPQQHAREVQRETALTTKMLRKLLEDQAVVDAAIAARMTRRDEAKRVLAEADTADGIKKQQPEIAQSLQLHMATQEADFAKELDALQAAQTHQRRLLLGVETLAGFKNVNAELVGGEGQGLTIKIELGVGIVANFSLDGENRRLCDIGIEQGGGGGGGGRGEVAAIPVTGDMAADILADARTLPSPQDLRYALFALSACQHAQAIFASHVSALRKRCLMRQNGSNRVQLTLANGVSASISAHMCYPEVPSGVYIDSLVGVGGWSMAELERVRVDINAKCFSSLNDLFEHLVGIVSLDK